MNKQVNTLQTLLFCPVYRKESWNLRERVVGWGRLACGAAITGCSSELMSCASPLYHLDSLVWRPPRDCSQRQQVPGPEGHSCSPEEGDLKTKFRGNGSCLPHTLQGEASPSFQIWLTCCSEVSPRRLRCISPQDFWGPRVALRNSWMKHSLGRLRAVTSFPPRVELLCINVTFRNTCPHPKIHPA